MRDSTGNLALAGNQAYGIFRDGAFTAATYCKKYCGGLQTLLGHPAARGKGCEIPDALRLLHGRIERRTLEVLPAKAAGIARAGPTLRQICRGKRWRRQEVNGQWREPREETIDLITRPTAVRRSGRGSTTACHLALACRAGPESAAKLSSIASDKASPNQEASFESDYSCFFNPFEPFRTGRGWARAAADFVLRGDIKTTPVIGRLVARGLDDKLKGSAFVVIDGVDGRAHHIRLPDLDAAGDCAPGSIVALRRYENRAGRQRLAIAVRSDFPIDAQTKAQGATWLDRRLVSKDVMPMS
ncbi:MAG: DUF3363 domain-containing protein [Methylocella sp.]